MAIVNNYGTLKAEMGADLFHNRLASRYDSAINRFEAAANTRLRVRQMEGLVAITISPATGAQPIPTDYLVWRTVLWLGRTPYVEVDYVHPAYLQSTQVGRTADSPRIFTIEKSTFHARPVSATSNAANTYEFHYYQKIPTLVPSTLGDATDNWLIREYPNAYIYGVLCELAGMQRNVDMAQLYKARRDEAFAEITQLSALTTGPAAVPQQRTADYF